MIFIPQTSLAHSVTLKCTDSDINVVGYNFYRSTGLGVPFTQINTSLTTTCAFVDNLVYAGKTYYYVAKAKSRTGALSGYSNQVKAVIPMVTAPSLTINSIK